MLAKVIKHFALDMSTPVEELLSRELIEQIGCFRVCVYELGHAKNIGLECDMSAIRGRLCELENRAVECCS